ncbi:hypothetical protein HGRIS_003217 [Hohenbuehelia grisea]|uniref:Uncharacterized protein n=1 Tax=Hohenbuehelia grisea TaxID=104357 RepID=A0ABR3JMS7_9AGAR
MSNTTTVEQVQRRMILPTDTTDVPPLQKKRGCEGPVWVPLRVCGFLIPYDFLVAYAEKNLPDDFEANAKAKEYSEIMIRDYRKQNALKHIKKLLDNPDKVLVRLADGGIQSCLLIGSNYDEEELTNACDLAVIDKFRKALNLDSTCMPRWYRIHRP